MSSINVKIRTSYSRLNQRAKNRGFPVSVSLGVYRRETGNDAGQNLQPSSAEKSVDGSEAPGEPIRVGGASPLRVATGGNANWSSEGRRRRSPAHTNRRRDSVILSMNAGLCVKLIEGKKSFPSNSLKGTTPFFPRSPCPGSYIFRVNIRGPDRIRIPIGNPGSCSTTALHCHIDCFSSIMLYDDISQGRINLPDL